MLEVGLFLLVFAIFYKLLNPSLRWPHLCGDAVALRYPGYHNNREFALAGRSIPILGYAKSRQDRSRRWRRSSGNRSGPGFLSLLARRLEIANDLCWL